MQNQSLVMSSLCNRMEEKLIVAASRMKMKMKSHTNTRLSSDYTAMSSISYVTNIMFNEEFLMISVSYLKTQFLLLPLLFLLLSHDLCSEFPSDEAMMTFTMRPCCFPTDWVGPTEQTENVAQYFWPPSWSQAPHQETLKPGSGSPS